MIITTTNNIEGYTIKKYIGVFNANVVIGTNLFSDIAASLTDVFGGRSGSYKNKLTTIYNEVIKELTSKVNSFQADAIVGLRVDFDEVSGSGKSMFMVSASGTAVILEKKTEYRYIMYDTLERIANYKDKGLLTNEEFEYEKHKILNQYNSPISEECKQINEENEREKMEELLKIEKAQKEKEQKLTIIEGLKESLKNYTMCSSVDDFENIDEAKIQLVSYDDIDFDTSDSMQYVISKFLRLNRIPEACKFYMEETGLEDLQSALEFCINVYKQIVSVNPEKVASIIPKLKVLKKRGFIEQAISEYQKLTISDRKTSEKFISSLEI